MSLRSVSKSDKWHSADVKITEDVDFDSMLLSEKLLEGLKNCGFEKPSPVQLQAIPLGRCGMGNLSHLEIDFSAHGFPERKNLRGYLKYTSVNNNLIVQAKSGTGKTGVLAVVALDTLVESPGTQVLVLAPTREIASQICGVIRSLGCAFPDLTCEVFIGGLPLSNDKANLPNCQIVVGTPGRIKQLIDMEYLKTDSIRLLIVDEADRLFDKQFMEDINWIFSRLPSSKQIIALSATYPDELADFLSLYMESPASVRINSKDPSLLGITQYFHITPFHPLPHINDSAKFNVLLDILNSVPFSQCMIFCQKQTKTQDLADNLVLKGFPAVGMCSALEQSRRLEIIYELKNFQCRVLVSTDLTARGIDAENVNLVVNFDLPYEGEVYLHRIGRAGRYGTRGMSISLTSDEDELGRLKFFQKKFILKIYQLPHPIPPDLWDRSVTLQARRIEELDGESSLEPSNLISANGKSDTTVHENPSECELDESPEKNDSTTFANHPERSVCNEAVRSSNEEKCSSSETSVAIINEEKQLVSSGKIFENTVIDVGSRVIDQAPSQKQDELQDTKAAKTAQDGELQVVGSGDVETGKTVVCEEFVQVTEDSKMLHNLYEGNSTLSSSEMVADINTAQKKNSEIASTSTNEGKSSNSIGSENPDESRNHRDFDPVKICDPGKMDLEKTASGDETLHRKVALSSLFQDWGKCCCDSEQENPDFSDQEISNILIPLLSTNRTKFIQSSLSYDKLVDSLKQNHEVAVSSLIKQYSETSECMDVTETQLKIFENLIDRAKGEYLSCVQEKFNKLKKDTIPCKTSEMCSEALPHHSSVNSKTSETMNADSKTVSQLPIASKRRNVLCDAEVNPEGRIEVLNDICSSDSAVLQNDGQSISEVHSGKECDNTNTESTKPNIPEKSCAVPCSTATQKSIECTKPSILDKLSTIQNTPKGISKADVSTKKSYIPFHAEKGSDQGKESLIGKDNGNYSHKAQLTKSEYDSINCEVKHFKVVSLPPASCSSPKDNSPPKVKQTSSGLFPKQIPKVNSQSVRRKDKSKEYASHQERKLQKQRGNSLHASKTSFSKQSSVNENAATERSSSLTQQNREMGRKPQMFFASNYTSVHPQVAKVNVDCRESRKVKTRKSKHECSFQNHHENEANSASLNCGVVASDIDYRQIGKVKSMKSRGENSFRDCHEDEINSTDFEDVDADIDHRKVKSSKSKYKHSHQSCRGQEINSAYVNKNPVNYAPSYFSHADFHEKCGPTWGYQNGVDFLPSNIGEYDFRSSSKHDTSSYYLTSPCNPRAFGLPYDCCCEMLRAQQREFCCCPSVQYYKKYLEYWNYIQQLTYGYHY